MWILEESSSRADSLSGTGKNLQRVIEMMGDQQPLWK